jgi:hypothetical protein
MHLAKAGVTLTHCPRRSGPKTKKQQVKQNLQLSNFSHQIAVHPEGALKDIQCIWQKGTGTANSAREKERETTYTLVRSENEKSSSQPSQDNSKSVQQMGQKDSSSG